MDIVRSLARRARHYVAVFGSLSALVVATLVPGLASAAQLTERSIALSSSAANASNVTYQINFTAVGAADSFTVDFCDNSPLPSDGCTPPSGFTTASAATSTSGYTMGTAAGVNSLTINKTISASDTISVDVTGIHNPTAKGPLYARITTLNSSTPVDQGGAAMYINDSIGVAAAVQESMTFCVSAATIAADCGGSLTAPSLTLGQTVGSTVALGTSTVSTGDVYTQLSTNAVGGAVVNLKSDKACGGLALAGDLTANPCYIAPAGSTGTIAQGDSKFGVMLNTPTVVSGHYQAASGSVYDNTDYRLKYTASNGPGVTSVYGDPLLDTQNGPVDNGNLKLTFGAIANNATPAGNYSADLSLIATGTF